MSHKSKGNKSKSRKTWEGYYPRKTKTKKEKLENLEKKYKKDLTNHE